MSRQNKLRSKARARRSAQVEGTALIGHVGVSGMPHKQSAPPWVRNGSRRPKAVKEREAKLQAERETAAREALKQRLREAVNEPE